MATLGLAQAQPRHPEDAKEVEAYIDGQDLLAISFDESSNVESDRIMNIAIATERGAFHYESIDLGTATVSAEFNAEIIGKRPLVITKEQVKRVNSISTDTCDTMLKTGRLLQSFPALNHTFMIPVARSRQVYLKLVVEALIVIYLSYLGSELILIDIRKPCRPSTCLVRYSWFLPG